MINPPYFPAKWASAYGEDEFGLWMVLTYKEVSQVFRWIVLGAFEMGSPKDERGRYSFDSPLHEVTFTKGFWLADTTVTQALWGAFMENNPAKFTKSVDNPVERVSWDDAQQFITKINTLLQPLQPEYEMRLPTEAQWEYACRAGTRSLFNYGEEADDGLMNYRGIWDGYEKWGGKAKKATAPVKSYPPNQWGLYEMHGNVWEWCQDEWREKIPATPVTDPLAEPEAGKQASHRVVRGGSWGSGGRFCRSAIRLWFTPDFRNDNLGFRLSLGLGATSSGARENKPAASKTQRVTE